MFGYLSMYNEDCEYTSDSADDVIKPTRHNFPAESTPVWVCERGDKCCLTQCALMRRGRQEKVLNAIVIL